MISIYLLLDSELYFTVPDWSLYFFRGKVSKYL